MVIGFGSFLKDYLEHYNISQVEFAERLDITPKHLNEILNKNIDISNELMVAISLITNIDINFIIRIENSKKIREYLTKEFGDNLKNYLKRFKINELEKYDWIKFKHKSDMYQNAIDILEFLKVRNFSAMNKITDKIMYKKKNDSDDTKILLWISRCNLIADKQDVSEFKIDNFNKMLIFLKKEANNKFNYERIKKEFNKNGFYFVIEKALPGTKIRGCAKVRGNKPTIYLTTMYNDKASLYFALYHELGHLKKNYSMAKNKYITLDEESLELEADIFALNQMIDEASWIKLINSNNIVKDIYNVSNEKNIPLCFVVRNLAYKGYIKYTDRVYLDNIEKIDI